MGERMRLEVIIRTIVNFFGQGKCTLRESRNFTICGCCKLAYVKNRETTYLDHLQHDSLVDISYKFTLEWVCFMHEHELTKVITTYTCIKYNNNHK